VTDGRLSIGPLTLETRVLAAPIAGFTDVLFRRTVRRLGGCGLIFTEMVSAGGWVEGNVLPERLKGVEGEPRPLGVQLWDREAAMIEEAARRLAALEISLIDLNFGCPKKRIMGKHAAGATLLRDPATVGRLVAAAVRGAGRVPVTAKIRLGSSVRARTAVEVALSAEASGAAAITVHGRTADQHYGVPCHRDLIAEVVQAVSVPVIANGDVADAASALDTLRETGAAAVMVARAALNRPWVFREIAAALCGEPIPPPPDLAPPRNVRDRGRSLGHGADAQVRLPLFLGGDRCPSLPGGDHPGGERRRVPRRRRTALPARVPERGDRGRLSGVESLSRWQSGRRVLHREPRSSNQTTFGQ
jgi:tRNA-dihydrouridine synthase B